MNSQPEARVIDPTVARFLDAVEASTGKASAEHRSALRSELETHIEHLIAENRTVSEAVKEMGDPRSIGRKCAKAWYRSTEPGTFWSAIGISAVANTVASSLQTATLQLFQLRPYGLVWDAQIVAYSIVMILPYWIAAWFAPKHAVAALPTARLVALVFDIGDLLALRHLPHGPTTSLRYLAAAAITVPLAFLTATTARRVRMRRIAGV